MGNSSSTQEKEDKKRFASPYQNQLEDLFQKLSNNGMVIQQDKFKEHFEGPTEGLAGKLFRHVSIRDSCEEEAGRHHKAVNHHRKDSFIKKSHDLLEQAYKVKDSQIRFYFELMVGQDAETTIEEVKKLLREACMYALKLVESEESIGIKDDDLIIDSLARTCVFEHTSICKEKFCSWALDFNPKVFSGLEAWLHEKFTGQVQKAHFHMLPMPDLTISEHSFAILTPSLLWYLCCVLPICYTRLERSHSYNQPIDSPDGDDSNQYTWNIIYDSNEHGLSLNRFKHKCMNYKSPTVTLVQFTDGTLIVLALDQDWRDSSERFGGPYSCLLEIIPNCSSILESQNIFYLRSSARSSATGLLIGENLPPKVKIEADLASAELVYKGPKKKDISKIEVWGCGGVLAIAAQKKQLDWEKNEIEKMRKVKKPGRWDENPDKQILDMAGIQTSHSQRGDM
eukprot:Seg782.17 transcript_id=Seg782.17/GoldUCD/mRNA.D3Y31 product="Restriction of telomere capping protein 5" protein_id=Seg782.17/GoldUCD/D3Y31